MNIQSFIDNAKARLTEMIPDLDARFSPEALDKLYLSLKSELLRLFTPTFNAIAQTARFGELEAPAKKNAVRDWLRDGGFDEIMRDFPYLYSALGNASERFCINLSEFVSAAWHLGAVTDITLYASDLHNGGRSAIIFCTGESKYVYKPRSQVTEGALLEFLSAISELGAEYAPMPVKSCGIHADAGSSEDTQSARSIFEFVEHAYARTSDDVTLYFQRCGALLALVELFGATDIHSENMIAHVNSPVLVDIETLLAGALPKRGQYDGGLADALMYSHVLPNWALDGDENTDIGALTGEGKNCLSFMGKPCHAYEHTDEITYGFARTYDFILANREHIARALNAFGLAQFRKLLRPTEVYGRLCDQLMRPRYLADEPARIECAGKLRRAYERDADPAWSASMQRVCKSEIDAVLRGDIPYFFTYGDERALRDWQGVVCEDYFALSPVENALRRLNMLNPTDMRDQIKIIEQSLEAVNPEIASIQVSSPMQVFEILESRALSTNPCSWIGVDTDEKGRAYIQSIGFDLYNGLLGVLCFYAALYEATGDARVKSALKTRYAPYREMYITTQTPITARADNINLTHGAGGHILALTYISRCLGDDGYTRDAAALISRFRFDENSIEQTDVYGGASGLLVALDALMGFGIDSTLKQIARSLADTVCAHAFALTGYGHGAAGEALALACAQTILGERRYETDILRMLRAENDVYAAAALNWPDLRDEEKRGFMHGICSGAPGMALARVKTLKQYTGSETRAICETDTARIREYYSVEREPLKRDSLCCGNAARVEGEKTLCLSVSNSRVNPAPVFYHALDKNDFPAGLFQGWAGIGYALTRVMPESVHGLFD